MIDKNMIALAEIRNGYTLLKYGNLTLEQNSLIKYDNLCLKLIEENQKYKEVIDKLEKYIEKETRIYGLSMSIELGTHFDNILGILKEEMINR